MICRRCTDADHAQCEDVLREQRHAAWVQALVRDKRVKLGERARLIAATKPYRSCPCQHKKKITQQEETA